MNTKSKLSEAFYVLAILSAVATFLIMAVGMQLSGITIEYAYISASLTALFILEAIKALLHLGEIK